MPRWRLRSVPAPAPAPAPAPSHSLSVSIAPALSLPFSPSSFPVPLPLARGGALSTLPLQLPPDLPSLSLSDGTSPLPFLSLASPFSLPRAREGFAGAAPLRHFGRSNSRDRVTLGLRDRATQATRCMRKVQNGLSHCKALNYMHLFERQETAHNVSLTRPSGPTTERCSQCSGVYHSSGESDACEGCNLKGDVVGVV